MPSPDIDAVVFDLGGVLIDWNPRYLYRKLFADPAEMEAFLAGVCTADWHRANDLGADVRESCRRLASQHRDYQHMITAWAERSEEMVAGPLEDTVQVLADLTAGGTRCLALSNMEAETFPLRLARYPFMKLFDGYVISGIERVAKPDHRIFEILMHRYGLRPEATFFVDDSAANVQAARELGIIAEPFTSAARLRQDLLALGLLR
ncbi:MAG: HAD family hydrolase [Streptosporangiaceae bacterium]